MSDEIQGITTDWAGKSIGIGTLVNVDNGGNVKNKSGAVTEVTFKGDDVKDIYVRVTGIKTLVNLQYVTVIELTDVEQVIYSLFSKYGVNLRISQVKDAVEKIEAAMQEG